MLIRRTRDGGGGDGSRITAQSLSLFLERETLPEEDELVPDQETDFAGVTGDGPAD